MNQKYQKLKTLLTDLFQLDQSKLDFGLNRILHAMSAEVNQFIEARVPAEAICTTSTH